MSAANLPAIRACRPAWNKGRIIGQKRPLFLHLSEPPFSRIDLVSCRNLMIHLGPEAQERVIARCCFALRSGGLLLLKPFLGGGTRTTSA